jgi:hypothetical protein
MRPSDQGPPSLPSITILSLVLFLSAAVVFILDTLYWLKYASWSAIKLSDIFRYYGISDPYFLGWSGALEPWGFLRNAPLSLLFLAIWFLFTGIVRTLFGSAMQNGSRGSGPSSTRWH